MTENTTQNIELQPSTRDSHIQPDTQQKISISHKNEATKSGAIMMILKGYLGSGILAMPYAFQQGGYVLGTIILAYYAILIYQSTLLLLKLQQYYETLDSNKKIGYSDLAKLTFGETGIFMVKIFFIMYSITKCIAYTIFFMKFFEHVFESNQDFIYLLLALSIILPMSFINNISVFTKFSMICNLMMTITLVYFFSKYQLFHIKKVYSIMIAANKIDDIESTFQQNVKNTFNFEQIYLQIGLSIYGMGIFHLIFDVKNSMKDPKNYLKIYQLCATIVLTLNVLFSISMVLGFGNLTQQIILFSIPGNDNIQIAFFQIIYAIALIGSYPLNLLPSFQYIEKITVVKNFLYENPQWRFWKRMILRFMINLVICIVAYLIPYFATVLSFVGSIGGTALNFIFPQIMYIKTFKQSITKQDLMLNYGIMIQGVLGASFAVIESLLHFTGSE